MPVRTPRLCVSLPRAPHLARPLLARLLDYSGRFVATCSILADDMGLGKTLQGVALIWTLLQAGHEALGGNPVCKRAMIVCPTSLVNNWDGECKKWLQVRRKAACTAGGRKMWADIVGALRTAAGRRPRSLRGAFAGQGPYARALRELA